MLIIMIYVLSDMIEEILGEADVGVSSMSNSFLSSLSYTQEKSLTFKICLV